jgi:hypothetical protein
VLPLFVAVAAGLAAASSVGAVPLAIAGYLGLWGLYAALARREVSARDALGAALVAGLALALAPPVLSDDVHRYLWDAHVARHGIDPYAHAPGDPALDGLDPRLRAAVSYPEIPTIYPPIAQLAFLVAGSVAEAPWAMQLLALALHLGTALLLARSSARAAGRYALCPLGLVESAGSGHIDVLAGLFLLAGVLSVATPLRAGLAFALATGTKLVGLLALPLLRGRALALGLLLGLLLAAPIFAAGRGSGASPGVAHYARRWQGAGPLFAALEGGVLGLLAPLADADGAIAFAPAETLARLAPGSAIDLYAPALGGGPGPTPGRVRRSVLAAALTRALVLGAIAAFALWRARGQGTPIGAAAALRDVLLVALALSPQVHPWYLLWALPLELVAGGVAVRALAAAMVLAYVPVIAFRSGGAWIEPPWLGPLLLAVLAVAAARERRLGWRARPGSETPPACAAPSSPSP